jgi:hypothetical protein
LQRIGPLPQRDVAPVRESMRIPTAAICSGHSHARVGQQLGVALGGRLAIEQRMAQRHQHRIGQHHHTQQVDPLRPPGVSSTTWVTPGGRAGCCAGQPTSRRSWHVHQALLVTLSQPGMRRLLEVGTPSSTGRPFARKPPNAWPECSPLLPCD